MFTAVLAINSDTAKSLRNCVRLCILIWWAQRNKTVFSSSNPFILEIVPIGVTDLKFW
jgi:hypothetical protein